jgi:hypothetical protein
MISTQWQFFAECVTGAAILMLFYHSQYISNQITARSPLLAPKRGFREFGFSRSAVV